MRVSIVTKGAGEELSLFMRDGESVRAFSITSHSLTLQPELDEDDVVCAEVEFESPVRLEEAAAFVRVMHNYCHSVLPSVSHCGPLESQRQLVKGITIGLRSAINASDEVFHRQFIQKFVERNVDDSIWSDASMTELSTIRSFLERYVDFLSSATTNPLGLPPAFYRFHVPSGVPLLRQVFSWKAALWGLTFPRISLVSQTGPLVDLLRRVDDLLDQLVVKMFEFDDGSVSLLTITEDSGDRKWMTRLLQRVYFVPGSATGHCVNCLLNVLADIPTLQNLLPYREIIALLHEPHHFHVREVLGSLEKGLVGPGKDKVVSFLQQMLDDETGTISKLLERGSNDVQTHVCRLLHGFADQVGVPSMKISNDIAVALARLATSPIVALRADLRAAVTSVLPTLAASIGPLDFTETRLLTGIRQEIESALLSVTTAASQSASVFQSMMASCEQCLEFLSDTRTPLCAKATELLSQATHSNAPPIITAAASLAESLKCTAEELKLSTFGACLEPLQRITELGISLARSYGKKPGRISFSALSGAVDTVAQFASAALSKDEVAKLLSLSSSALELSSNFMPAASSLIGALASVEKVAKLIVGGGWGKLVSELSNNGSPATKSVMVGASCIGAFLQGDSSGLFRNTFEKFMGSFSAFSGASAVFKTLLNTTILSTPFQACFSASFAIPGLREALTLAQIVAMLTS